MFVILYLVGTQKNCGRVDFDRKYQISHYNYSFPDTVWQFDSY